MLILHIINGFMKIICGRLAHHFDAAAAYPKKKNIIIPFCYLFHFCFWLVGWCFCVGRRRLIYHPIITITSILCVFVINIHEQHTKESPNKRRKRSSVACGVYVRAGFMFPSAFFWRRQSSTFCLLAPLLVTASFTWMSRGSHTFRQFAASAAMSATTTTTASSSSRPNKAALVFLHGLGDGPWGWAHLQEELPRLQPRLAASNGIRYVFPAAPTIPIAINGGARMPGCKYL